MKERKEREVKTSTLKTLLILFYFVWWAIFIKTFILKAPIMPIEVVVGIVIAAFLSVFLSFITVSVIAILLRWKI